MFHFFTMEINTRCRILAQLCDTVTLLDEYQDKIHPGLSTVAKFSQLMHFHHVERIHERANHFW